MFLGFFPQSLHMHYSGLESMGRSQFCSSGWMESCEFAIIFNIDKITQYRNLNTRFYTQGFAFVISSIHDNKRLKNGCGPHGFRRSSVGNGLTFQQTRPLLWSSHRRMRRTRVQDREKPDEFCTTLIFKYC